MREIGAEHAVGRGAPDGVAVDAGDGGEQITPGPDRGDVRGHRPLRRHPAGEVVRRVHGHGEEHARVLHAAELGALPDVGARRPRLHPRPVALAGDDVHLARELGDPEAVNHVGRLQRDERGRRPGDVADRDVQLVGGHDP